MEPSPALARKLPLAAASASPDDRSATEDASEWLRMYLAQHQGSAPAGKVLAEGKKDGHSDWSLRNARKQIGATIERGGFPCVTLWTVGTNGEAGITTLSCDDLI